MIERWPATSPMVPRTPVDENTLDNGHAREVDDGLNIYRRFLASKCEESPRSSTSQLIAYFSTFL